MIALARQCVRFHDLLFSLINRELRARYRGSVLGSAWMLIQPVMFLVIYYVIFIEFFRMKMPEMGKPGFFALAMFAGLVPWIAFSEALSRATGSVIENGNLIKKFCFPSELLPVYLVGVSLFNTTVGFFVVGVAVFVLHGDLPRMMWMFPIVLILQGCFTLGLAYLFSSIAVFIRDLGQMVPMMLTFWFFLSPIFIFTKLNVPSDLAATVFILNPVTYFVELYRAMFIYEPATMETIYAQPGFDRSKIPLESPVDTVPWSELGILAAVAVVVLFVGLRVFMRLKPRFADEV